MAPAWAALALRVPSRETVRRRTVRLEVGQELDRDGLVETLVQEGGERVLELSKYGCVVNERFGGINVGAPETILGQGITLPQVKYLKDRGVEFVENVIITKLIQDLPYAGQR